MQHSTGSHSQRWILTLLLVVISSLPIWAQSDSKLQTAPSAGAVTTAKTVDVASHTRGFVFAYTTCQWVPLTFGQTPRGHEFYFGNQLCRVLEAGKAQIILSIDAGRLVEADLPYDKASRRPTTGDAVQILGKDARFAAHTALGAVQPGSTIRFSGKAYKIAADGKLVDTGTTFSAAGSTLQRIEITQSALQHISDRHTVQGKMNAGKGTFNSQENLQTLIKNAELLAPVPQANGNCQRVYDAGRNIGISRATGKSTSVYTVITTHSGKLVTAFPGLP